MLTSLDILNNDHLLTQTSTPIFLTYSHNISSSHLNLLQPHHSHIFNQARPTEVVNIPNYHFQLLPSSEETTTNTTDPRLGAKSIHQMQNMQHGLHRLISRRPQIAQEVP